MRRQPESFESPRSSSKAAVTHVQSVPSSFNGSRTPPKSRSQHAQLDGIESGGSDGDSFDQQDGSLDGSFDQPKKDPSPSASSNRQSVLRAVEAELDREYEPPRANTKTWLLPSSEATPSRTRRGSIGAMSRRASSAASKVPAGSVAIEQAGCALLEFLERPTPLLPQQRLESLWAICRAFAPLLRAETASVFKVDKPAGQLVIDPGAGGLAARPQVLPLAGIVGAAVAGAEPLVVADTARDSRFAPEVDHVLDRPRSVVALPIMCSSRGVAAGSVGFIALYGRPEPGEWSADQLTLLQGASHAMHACMEQWHNAQQACRAEDELHTLRDKVHGHEKALETQRLQLNQLNMAHDCMMSLAKQMGSEGIDSIMVLKDTVTSFKKLIECDRCSVFKLEREQGTLELHSNELDSVIIMPISAGIAGHVGSSGELVNIKDAYDDPRFNKSVDVQTGYRTKSILCAPILGMDGSVLAVVQLINKHNKRCEFTEQDVRFLTKLSSQMGLHLHNALFYDQYAEDRVRMRALLRMAKRVTPADQDMVSALRTTVQEFKRILTAERCSVYACFKEQETMVLYTDLMEGWTAPIAMPITTGIAGIVATTGRLVNVKDAYSDGRFNRDVDKKTGFRTKTMLVCPIKSADRDKKVIAVAQLINKTDGKFTRDDEITMTHACEIVASTLQNMLLRERRGASRAGGADSPPPQRAPPAAPSSYTGGYEDDASLLEDDFLSDDGGLALGDEDDDPVLMSQRPTSRSFAANGQLARDDLSESQSEDQSIDPSFNARANRAASDDDVSEY